MAQWLFTLFREKGTSPIFLSESKFLQTVVAKKKAVAESRLPQSVPTTTEALLLLHDISYVNSCI